MSSEDQLDTPVSAFSPAPDQRQGQDHPPPGPHVARAGRYFRNVRYIIFLAAFGAGLWFLYDGFVGYPFERGEYRRLQAEIEDAQLRGESIDELAKAQRVYDDHSDADILLQKILGFALPPLALLMLIRWLYISRGTIRMDEHDTLHVPGHPPIPASAVKEMDDALWDRKGISYVEYRGTGGDSEFAKLDDFVYERAPIDAIHDRLAYLVKQRAPEA